VYFHDEHMPLVFTVNTIFLASALNWPTIVTIASL
jgi:hypothetical protein